MDAAAAAAAALVRPPPPPPSPRAAAAAAAPRRDRTPAHRLPVGCRPWPSARGTRSSRRVPVLAQPRRRHAAATAPSVESGPPPTWLRRERALGRGGRRRPTGVGAAALGGGVRPRGGALPWSSGAPAGGGLGARGGGGFPRRGDASGGGGGCCCSSTRAAAMRGCPGCSAANGTARRTSNRCVAPPVGMVGPRMPTVSRGWVPLRRPPAASGRKAAGRPGVVHGARSNHSGLATRATEAYTRCGRRRFSFHPVLRRIECVRRSAAAQPKSCVATSQRPDGRVDNSDASRRWSLLQGKRSADPANVKIQGRSTAILSAGPDGSPNRQEDVGSVLTDKSARKKKVRRQSKRSQSSIPDG